MMSTEVVRILSFDPAITVAGWAVSDYDLTTGGFMVRRFGNLLPSKIVSHADKRDLVETFGRKIIALDVLSDMVIQLMDEHKPDFVVLENAFINGRFPNAFISLVSWISTIEMLLYKKYGKPTYRLAPKQAKRIISGDGTSDKLNIQNAVLANERITFKQKRQMVTLDEHEADAISIGYGFCVSVLPGLLAEVPVTQ